MYADNATVAGLADKSESLARSFYSCEHFLTCHLGFEKSVQTGIKCAKYPCTVMFHLTIFIIRDVLGSHWLLPGNFQLATSILTTLRKWSRWLNATCKAKHPDLLFL